MPVYNQKPAYLRPALRSVLRQTYRNFAFVIVIDGADAQTVQTVKEETKDDPRVTLLYHQKNQGVAKALNTGFKTMMALPHIQYLTWVSSDNVYYPDFLKTLRNTLHRGPEELGLVYSSFRHIDGEGKVIRDINLVDFRRWQRKDKKHLLNVCFVGVSFMYKKSVALAAGEYRMEPVEDYDYWLRLTEHCDIEYIPIELMDYRANSPGSVSETLRGSKAQHRRWRYGFQLAKHQARQRRGIPFETTVIFPVRDGSEKTVNQLETLLEQFYSNYKLLIMDLSPSSQATSVLQHLSDPRIAFVNMPSANEKEALLQGVRVANTPFSMVYGTTSFMPMFFLENMASELQKSSDNVLATFMRSDGSVGHQVHLTANEPFKNKLYRTTELFHAIKQTPGKLLKPLPKVFINSVPKSGTHLMLQIILGIPGMMQHHTPWHYPSNLEGLNKILPGQVGMGHFPYKPSYSQVLKELGFKVIFISRDPRDVAVSLAHFTMKKSPIFGPKQHHPLYPYLIQQKTHEERLMTIIKGTPPSSPHRWPNIFQYTYQQYNWLNAPDVCHIKFEDLIQPSSQKLTVMKIIRFLSSDLEGLRLSAEELAQKMIGNIQSETSETFRKGKIGGWRAEFTAQHKAVFKQIAGELLVQLGYEKNLNW
ncbi:glycosyltransferase [Salinithrix halophila]|uniref:Glycosyltransferase n=2 Tax=Salinithrix halophila TaxID=1485204 RepID=A0ABV8JG45_9BACL